MVITHMRSAGKGKTYIYIPSFLRADFGITEKSKVDITKEDGKIVIRIDNDKQNEVGK